MRFSPDTAASLLQSETTLGCILMLILVDRYEDDVFTMDPIELWLTVEDDFKVRIPEQGENRINAAITAMTSDTFYQDPLTMRSIATALYHGDLGDLVDGVLEDITFPELLWATHEVGLLRGDDEEFAPSVRRFIDEAMREESEEQTDGDEDQVLPYALRFLEDMLAELEEQLSMLGVSREEVSEFLEV